MFLEEQNIYESALAARGLIDRLYLHWSAGRYDQIFPDYHLSIDGLGRIFQSAALTAYLPHTWQRNSRAVSLCLCCAFGATPSAFGAYAPTPLQIEVLCKASAILLKGLALPLSFETVRTHAEQADEDNYGPATSCERWDLWMLSDREPPGSGGATLRRKIAYYLRLEDI